MPKKPKKFYKKVKAQVSEEKPPVKKKKKKDVKQKASIGINIPPPIVTEVESPKKSRPIAERVTANTHSFFKRNLFLLSFIGILSFVGIMLVAGQIKIYYVQLERIEKEKKNLEIKYAQMEETALLHPGSRDVYLQLANISYQLGNKEKAQAFTERALLLDPNYQQAIKLKEILEKGE